MLKSFDFMSPTPLNFTKVERIEIHSSTQQRLTIAGESVREVAFYKFDRLVQLDLSKVSSTLTKLSVQSKSLELIKFAP